MIAVIDYGMGNLRSVLKAFEYLGFEARLAYKPEDIKTAERIVLPGVGAFAHGMQGLHALGIIEALIAQIKAGKPLLGICLGMQMLFSESLEYGRHNGLGLIEGTVRPLPAGVKIPHMGWNELLHNGDTLFSGVENGSYMYFVHSYYADTDEKNITAKTSYGIDFAAAVRKDNVWGMQFHPEKSGDTGLNILKNFGGASIV